MTINLVLISVLFWTHAYTWTTFEGFDPFSLSKRNDTTTNEFGVVYRRLTSTMTISSSSIFGVYAPLQCLAGNYCAGRSGSVMGTGACPQGFFCPSGSVAPQTAPPGSFVAGTGSVRAYTCSSSTFAPFPGLPYCLPCPPGYSCSDQGTTVPQICSPGTFRPSFGSGTIAGTSANANSLALNSISCQSCPDGTYSFIRGVPNVLDCEPCPSGRICLSKTGNITQSYPCSEGYFCGEGVTLTTSTANICPNGFVCNKGTSPITVSSYLCPAAFVCQAGTTFADQYRLRCPIGFYCPTASPWSDIMGFPLLPGVAYFSLGQFHSLQVSGQYCMRQWMMALTAQAEAENTARVNSGRAPLTDDQRAIIIAQWADHIPECIASQVEKISYLNANNKAVTQLILDTIEWHGSAIFSLLPDKRLDEYSNKCDTSQFSRPTPTELGVSYPVTTVWDCMCSGNYTDGSLILCLSNTTATTSVTPSLLRKMKKSYPDTTYGAPFSYNSTATIDSNSVCLNWPDCLDFARVFNVNGSDPSYAWAMTVPGTPPVGVGVWDDFDKIATRYMDYVMRAVERNFLLFANVSGDVSSTQCPLGTVSASDGLVSLVDCEKRLLVPLVTDPDEVIVYRVNPINSELGNGESDIGYPRTSQEDLRRVFTVRARELVTITIDVRDLPDEIQYGRDWRVQVFVNNQINPDSDEPQICYDIARNFYAYQLVIAGTGQKSNYAASYRQQQMDEQSCSLLLNPLSFEAFQYATIDPAVCPSQSGHSCFFKKLTSDEEKIACNPSQITQKVHEMYLHPLVDIEVKIEIQILNGMYLPDRFKFIESVTFNVSAPARAEIGTDKTFVIEYSAAMAGEVFYPYNLPMMAVTAVEDAFYGTTPSGNVSTLVTSQDGSNTTYLSSIVAASSQSGILTKAFLSWLPRDTHIPLTNCMRHPNAWSEFLYQSEQYFQFERQTVYQTHLPYFSNCRGYGTAIPLWHLLETTQNTCSYVAPNETVSISELSVGATSVGDFCAPTTQIECMVDEVPNDKQPLPRWFESQTGAWLFSISSNALTDEEYGTVDGGSMGKTIPVILRAGSSADGTSLHTVDLVFRYWQQTSTEKVLTSADVFFSNFSLLTDAQSKGDEPWTYTLKVTWSPMSYIEVFNAYAFSFWVYLGIVAVVGMFSLVVTLGNWVFHYIASESRAIAAKLTDKRYWTLMFPAITKGVALALIPAMSALFIAVLVFVGETTLFSFTTMSCDSTDPLGCKVSFLDGLASSWSGETLNDPTTYQTRRNGRVGTVLILIGTYIILHSMKAFMPNLVSHYYDKEEESDEPESRSWPPDQQTFAPLVWKRSTWFFLIGGNCFLLTLLLEFSYAQAFSDNWWSYLIVMYVVGKAVGIITVVILKEELLKVPIIAVYQAIMQVSTLGSPDYYSFIITMLITQLIFLIDRLYIMPNESMIAADIGNFFASAGATLKLVMRGGSNEESATNSMIQNNPNSMLNDVFTSGQVGETVAQVAGPSAADANSAERDASDKMLLFLSSYSSNVMAALLTPLTIILMYLFYAPSQSLNNYNVPIANCAYYWGFQAVMLIFKFLSDLVAMNTAEIYHEWKLLDYLEYCRYRFMARPNRWKGIGESSDEMMTPELRSLDLYCFSSQYYFSCFFNALGAIFVIIGMQIVINNVWNVFDDQASMFIILGGMLLLGLLRFAFLTTADYLKLWVDRQHKTSLTIDMNHEHVDDSDSEEETDANKRITEQLGEEPTVAKLFALSSTGERVASDTILIHAPIGSALFNWPQPAAGDRAGWDRYRSAYLRENQLWLQAHMDNLVDPMTIIEYRRKLMDSLARVLKETNILGLELKRVPLVEHEHHREAVTRTAPPVPPSSDLVLPPPTVAKPVPALELSAAPPHEGAAARTWVSRNMYKETAVEAAAVILLNRARFMKFVRDQVEQVPLVQAENAYHATPYCESCGTHDMEAGVFLSPMYPVSMVADEFRVQRDLVTSWNVPVWQHFYSEFTPVCTMCENCRVFYSDKNFPVQVGQLAPAETGIVPVENILDQPGFVVPETVSEQVTLALPSVMGHWLAWAEELVTDPMGVNTTSVLARTGYICKKFYAGTVIEDAVVTLTVRSRFVKFLRQSVSGIPCVIAPTGQQLYACDACGGDEGELAIAPMYPVSVLADAFRSAGDNWDMHAWREFVGKNNFGCVLCTVCKDWYAVRNTPVQIRDLDALHPVQVLRHSPWSAGPFPSSLPAFLEKWNHWASSIRGAPVDSVLAQSGYFPLPRVSPLAETAAVTLLNRARFVLELRMNADMDPLTLASPDMYCQACGAEGTRLLNYPVFPLSAIADEFMLRSQRWDMSQWPEFFQAMNRTCVICDSCMAYYAPRSIRVPVNAFLHTRPTEQPEESFPDISPSPMTDEVRENLSRWLSWADEIADPRAEGVDPDSILLRSGYGLGSPIYISDTDARILIEWVSLVRSAN
jgi:hypothetical protein